ncbi:MAG: DUF309 domain-containing protein [Armatimonadota bacterium]|nr:DUF309 domain-containing protein [Armatimonadota bacterium]MDR7454576.1 DUF309 domain-containing protein [Armatimonadota bacterium]MDR7495947.1 DUF309 domain-containing protein [Armatimonadota bacterium]MDR7511291.1 DUF309 domain-containing protein [Armatimonadota bacterium]
MYVRLKHTLSELALRALGAPPARRAAVWLRAYCELAAHEGETTPEAGTSARPEAGLDVPLRTVATRARRAGGGTSLPRWLLARGLLERDGPVVRLPEPYRDHFPYLRRHAHRLTAALRWLRRPAPRGVPVHMARAAALFDAGLFFECHEYLEGIWRRAAARDRPFYQGIILVAAAFYHYEKGNAHGVRSKLAGGFARLDGYRPVYRGVLVDRWLRRLTPWRARAASGIAAGPLRPADIPRLPLGYPR